MLSPEDAIYCCRFVFTMHNMETPRFSTLQFLDKFINAVSASLYCTTEDESSCLGLFLAQAWKKISEWRYNHEVYVHEISEKPAAVWFNGKGDEAEMKILSHLDYISIYDKWHAILGMALVGCLKSKEYMHRRTALIIASRIVEEYPTKYTTGEKLLTALKPLLGEGNAMQDIRAMAQGYQAQIIKVRNNGVWKEESKIHQQERQEKLKKEEEIRRKNAEEQHKAMKIDSDQITRTIGSDSRNFRRPTSSGQLHGNSGLKFTPADQRTPRLPPDDRGMNPPPRGPPLRQAQPPPQQDRWKRGGPIEGKGGEGNRTGNLQGRWEGSNDSRKRGRSPEKGRESGGRDSKRPRAPSPPRGRRGGGRR